MRVILILLALIAFLGWGGFELRERNREVSQILFALAALLGILLFAAFFGLLGN
jgi:hypothetical protein